MIKAVIIDDESNGRKILLSYLKKYCPNVNIIGQADGVLTGKKIIDAKKPNLVFLDIEMKDGSGFDLLEKFNQFSFAVIFVTAHNDYALKAFRCSAIDYLLKPVLPEELIKAVNKFSKDLEVKNLSYKLENLMGNKNEIKKLALPTDKGIELLKITDIVFCESSGNYTVFFTNSHQKIMVSKTIKSFETILCDYNFFRIHQSYLVNLDYITKFNKNDGGYVILSNNKKLPVSRRNKQAFLESILK